MLQLKASRSAGSGQRCLVPEVVKLLASPDMVVKKLASWYLLETTDQEDLVLLAVNTLLQDCRNSNPMLRGQALRTLAGLPQSDLTQYAVNPLMAALRDPSAYVRRVAVTGCVKIHSTHPSLLTETGVVDSLYAMIRDPDPVVVTNSLSALETMLAGEGGVVINRNIAHYLLNRLEKFQDWGLVTVFELLKKYTPSSEEEVLDMMNITDSYLSHHSMPVVLACLHFFLHLITHLPHLRSHLFLRAKPQLVAGLGSGHPELTYILLDLMSSLLAEDKARLVENYRAFFCKYNEPVYVKEKKISLLPRLLSEENSGEIVEELSLYSTDLNPAISQQAIAALASIAHTAPDQRDQCLHHLLHLLTLHIDYVSANVLHVLQWLELRHFSKLRELLHLLPGALRVVTSTSGTAATWWLIGEYGEDIEDAVYLLEETLAELGSETCSEVKMQLLLACVKLFLKRPPEMQDCLGRSLEVFMSAQDHDLQDRARFYYNLLKTDVRLARRLVLGDER